MNVVERDSRLRRLGSFAWERMTIKAKQRKSESTIESIYDSMVFFCPFFRKGDAESVEKTTMSVRELASQMNISLPKAYELVKTA